MTTYEPSPIVWALELDCPIETQIPMFSIPIGLVSITGIFALINTGLVFPGGLATMTLYHTPDSGDARTIATYQFGDGGAQPVAGNLLSVATLGGVIPAAKGAVSALGTRIVATTGTIDIFCPTIADVSPLGTLRWGLTYEALDSGATVVEIP